MITIAAQRAPLVNRKDDLYETPECATRALLTVDELPTGAVWEPACGPGATARVLRAAGHEVWATDLVDYASPNPDSRSGARMNDRAAVVTTAIMQMIATAPKHELRQAIEDYLRDEFVDLARTALNEIRHEDE